MSPTDRSQELFLQGYNCAQATFAAFAEEVGMNEAICLTLASTFGGGLGRQASVCGAVTGALMVLGLRYGSAEVPSPEEKKRVYGYVGCFLAAFKARHGSMICKELLGCDISTPEGMEQALAKNFHTDICPQFVRAAAEILVAMEKE
jgi:C_GCAxxG_C_C family probable redox protein